MNGAEPYILIFLSAAVILLLILTVALLVKSGGKGDKESIRRLGILEKQLDGISDENSRQISQLKDDVARSLRAMSESFAELYRQGNENLSGRIGDFENRIRSFEQSNSDSLSKVKEEVSAQLEKIRSDNRREMDEIRHTVDTKLQSTLDSKLSESFRTVSDRLEQVYKGLGEMQTLAGSVGDLKKVLSNVKTRGIMGEIQLGAIISEILSPSQYDTEQAVVPGSANRVEFAVKLPGDKNSTVYLPIDSKFPADAYTAYLDAAESCDKRQTEEALKALKARLKGCAKDIHDKYICVPYTTSFAIMFLPFEGLYAQAVNCGMVEELQRQYNVNIAGPSTMAALLNSIQMGFRTIAVQQHSSEVWRILSEVRTEFDKFADALAKTQDTINKAGQNLENLVGARTRAITKKLDKIEVPDEHFEI